MVYGLRRALDQSFPSYGSSVCEGVRFCGVDVAGRRGNEGLRQAESPAISVFYPEKDKLYKATWFEGVYSFEELRTGMVADLASKSGEERRTPQAFRLWDAPQ